MKTAISVPDRLFARVEYLARKLEVSRSEFFATAARRYADELEDRDSTAAIDAAMEVDTDDTQFVSEAARLTFERSV